LIRVILFLSKREIISNSAAQNKKSDNMLKSKQLNENYFLSFEKNIVNLHYIPKLPNIFKITINNNTELLDKYFLLPSINNIFQIYLNVDDDSYFKSFNHSFISTKVDILSTDNNIQIATKIKDQLDISLDDYFIITRLNNVLTFTNKEEGKTLINPMDGNTNFTFEIVSLGQDNNQIVKKQIFNDIYSIFDVDLNTTSGDLTLIGNYFSTSTEIEYKKEEILTTINYSKQSKTYDSWFSF